MCLQRHQQFRLETEKKWTEKWFKFLKDDNGLYWIHWSDISSSPNVTMEFIEAHPKYNWDWYVVLENKFTKNKELFMIEEARKYIAIYKIKKWWKNIYYSPNTKVGKKRLNKSYDALFE